MNLAQPGILAGIPPFASYLFFHALPGAELAPALQRLAALTDGQRLVVGLGESLVLSLGQPIAGLHAHLAVPGGIGVVVVRTEQKRVHTGPLRAQRQGLQNGGCRHAVLLREGAQHGSMACTPECGPPLRRGGRAGRVTIL